MEHNIPLITTLAAAFVVALILGFLAERIRVPALVGYLVAGIIIGRAHRDLSSMCISHPNSRKSASCC